jgi:TDG/mug DNA glycosylase family protein
MFATGKCLYLSGLTPEPMTADDDYKLLQVGIGFTNMVSRATKGSADLTRKEIKEGMLVLYFSIRLILCAEGTSC